MSPISISSALFLGANIFFASGLLGMEFASRKARSATCKEGPGIEETRTFVNGLQAMKKVLQRQVFLSSNNTLGIMGKMIQYKYLLRYLQTNDEAFANGTKLSIYSAVLDGVTTKTCSYVNTLVNTNFRINCTDPVEVTLTALSLELMQGITNMERSLPNVDCLDPCQWIRQTVPEQLSQQASNIIYCHD
ncbi:hypothetical protein EMCRGX_G019674 [Ephydatia muelleri]